ncbi:transposase [Pleurocapsales cyanobacterium LEGE 06147]|nr:transposase [Pleurocapsales cyanobacterium LEGE 06147]
MTSKLETLAKLYLEGEPAEISEQTKQDFCNWMMSEFQQLPFAVQASNAMEYDTVTDMFDDITQNHLWVSLENYGSDIYPNLFCGFALLAVHDYDHYRTGTDFSLEGEIAAYRRLANRSPSLEIQKILYSELVLKSAAHLYLEHKPEPKVVFP